MPSLSSLLLRIPDQFKPLAALGIGSLILVILVLLHGFGLHEILVEFKRATMRLRRGRPHLARARLRFGWAIFQMLLLHIMEITAWAFALVHLGLIVHAADSVYFCANAYTTLGYGAVDLGIHWRTISPIIAISGLFTFAWTTSTLVSMVTSYVQLIEQLEGERMEELDMRAAAREAECDTLIKEKQAESGSRGPRRKPPGKRFLRGGRFGGEKRDEDLQQAARDKVRGIREQECADEQKLGDIASPGDPESKK